MNIEKMEIQVLLFFYIYVYIFWILRELSKIMKLSMWVWLICTEEAHDMGMRIRLYGMERMRRERMIGETIIGFASLNLDVTSTHWIILEPRSNLSVRSLSTFI